MGKNLIQQARGKGSPTYKAPSFRYKGKCQHKKLDKETAKGVVLDIIHCQGHSAPLAQVEFEDKEQQFIMAAEGLNVGGSVSVGEESEVKIGNTLPLKSIPEGTYVYNIESIPGDGGKFVRASGTFARVFTKLSKGIIVILPSKKQKTFDGNCRACVGIVAGGGRPDKPLLKAGNAYYKMKAKNKLWPKVSGSAMNAVDHPFGNGRSSRKSKARPVPRNAPPGRKVGMIAAKKTGKKR